MMLRLASLCAGLALAALLMSGCFTQPGDGVFGPADSLGGDEASRPALSLKASPARGPGPLEVEFSLSARDGAGGLAWALDFGDRTAPAAGTELPAHPRHTYASPGAYVATLKVQEASGDSLLSTLSIVVLEGLATATGTPSPTLGPEPPPQYSPPPSGGGGAPPPSASNTTTPPSNQTSSSTSSSSASTTSPPPPSNSSTSSTTASSSSTSTSDTGTTSSTASETQTSTSSISSSSSESGTSTAPEPTGEPSPTGSESSTSSDPPL